MAFILRIWAHVKILMYFMFVRLPCSHLISVQHQHAADTNRFAHSVHKPERGIVLRCWHVRRLGGGFQQIHFFSFSFFHILTFCFYLNMHHRVNSRLQPNPQIYSGIESHRCNPPRAWHLQKECECDMLLFNTFHRWTLQGIGFGIRNGFFICCRVVW